MAKQNLLCAILVFNDINVKLSTWQKGIEETLPSRM